jgi:hypothetical protein
MAEVYCGSEPCPLFLNSTCVFYTGESLLYIGVQNNDTLEAIIVKINQAFQNAGVGYAFTNGLIQPTPFQPVQLGGALIQNTTIGGNFTLAFTGNVQAARHITTGGSSSQFVKGDGTLDSTAYQPAANYITGLSGDATASGPGVAAMTLATVNFASGTFGNGNTIPIVTVNAKGLVTNITPVPVTIPPLPLTFIGDVVGSGFTGSNISMLLQNVNANPYNTITPLKFTVNGKGLVTSASPITASDIINILGFNPGTSGTSGSAGSSGTSGTTGTSGTSGTSATSGTSGTTGTSGTSATSGTSGTSGTDGTGGTSGTSGSTGTSGTAGTSGTSATSGTSGTTGSSGTSGTSGSTGTSGSSGTTGTSGSSGTTGTSGSSGTSGTTGTSGTSGTSGSTGTSGSSGLSGDRFKTTSTTTYTLQAPGNPGTLTVDPGLAYTVAQSIIIAYDANNHNEAEVTSYNSITGVINFVTFTLTGSGTYSSWFVNIDGASGGDGSSGSSGTSGTSATAGTSGTTGTSGSSGTSGTTGTSGSSGTSGTSATNGTGGTSGTSGSSGTSGTTGTSGTSATSGTSGTSATSGTTGTSGTSGGTGTGGTSGTSGSSATSGTSGTSGVNGAPGAGGTSGTSGTSVAVSGTTNTLAKFTSATTIGNSIVTDNGSLVSIGGALTATGNITGAYILGSYFNASAGNSENPTIGQIWTQNTSDNYLRKSTPAHLISQLGLVTGGPYLPLSGGTLTGPLTIGTTVNSVIWNDGTGTYMENTGNSAATRVIRLQTHNGSFSYTQLFINGGGGYVEVNNQMRAPIFYDSNDTTYYLDPNSTGISLSSNGIVSSGTGTSGGFQNRTYTSGRNRIWSFGNADAYGISYFQGPDYIGLHFGTATQAASQFWVDNSGISQSSASSRAPIFYDSNNTAYYLDPASGSRINAINYDNLYFSGDATYGFLGRNVYADTVNGRGADPLELNYYDGGGVIIGAGGTKSLTAGDISANYNLVARSNTTSGAAGGVINLGGSSADPSSLGNGGIIGLTWGLRSDSSPYYMVKSTYQSYGPYSYNRLDLSWHTGIIIGADTLYGGVRFYNNSLNIASSILFSVGDGDSAVRATSDMRAPIFYDLDNTAYYVNPNGLSYLYSLELSGTSHFRPRSWVQFDGNYGLYWPNNYGAHFSPNDLSTYTQFTLRGSKSGYGGINDGYSQVQGMMYDSAGNGGVYREANGRWYFYYLLSSDCMGIGTSTTSPTYSLYLTKGVFAQSRIDATIYYDSANSAYYLDPSGGSYLAGSLEIANGYLLTNGVGGAIYINSAAGGFGGYVQFRQHAVIETIVAGYHVYVLDSTGTGVVKYNGAQSWSAQSDGRIKTVHSILENNLSKLDAINPIYYSFNNFADDKNRIGLIAQEVQEHFPELVNIDPKTDYLTLDYTGLIPVLLGAIKELKNKVETLETQIQ